MFSPSFTLQYLGMNLPVPSSVVSLPMEEQQEELLASPRSVVMMMPSGLSNKRRYAHHRKGVSFDPHVYIRETLHYNDYTPEEHAAMWISAQEYAKTKRKLAKLAHALSRKATPPSALSRGLECLVPDRALIKLQAREAVRNHVIRSSSTTTSMTRPHLLAEQCRRLTCASQTRALLQGMQDAQWVLIQDCSHYHHATAISKHSSTMAACLGNQPQQQQQQRQARSA